MTSLSTDTKTVLPEALGLLPYRLLAGSALDPNLPPRPVLLTWQNRKLDEVFARHCKAGTLSYTGLVRARNELVELWPHIRGERVYGQGMSESGKTYRRLVHGEDEEQEVVLLILTVNAMITSKRVPHLMVLDLEGECAQLS